MRQTIIKCDLCDKVVTEDEVRNVPILVKRSQGSTDVKKLDLCKECLDIVTMAEMGEKGVKLRC